MKTRQELAKTHFRGTGVELGVAAGRFSDWILRESACTVLWGVDRWTEPHHDLQEYISAAHRLALAAQDRRGQARSLLLRMTFQEAAPLFGPEYFDFIYIDGYAHTGQEGGQTLHDWWPKLKPGGVFAGHDYCAQTFPQTVAAVDAFVQEHGLELRLTEEATYPSWCCMKL